MTPIHVVDDQLESAVCALPSGFSQAHRMLRYLAEHPNASTVQVAADCAIGNLSDVASKANRYLFRQGLMISCKKPADPIPNRFGEPSRMYLWGLYTITEAANDDCF